MNQTNPFGTSANDAALMSALTNLVVEIRDLNRTMKEIGSALQESNKRAVKAEKKAMRKREADRLLARGY